MNTGECGMVKKNARVRMDGVGSTVMASTYFPLTVDVSINVDYGAEHSYSSL